MQHCASRLGSRGWMALAALAAGALGASADTIHWTALSGDWTAVQNWTNLTTPSETRVPEAGDDVEVTSFGSPVLLAASTPMLGSVTVQNAALTFSNWATLLSASNVAVGAGGVLTCAGPFTNTAMSNRVNLACGTLVVESAGAIDVTGKGFDGGTTVSNGVYAGGHGPGGGTYGSMIAGASYGGYGMFGQGAYAKTNTYGSAEAPLDPGSGGGAGNNVGSRGGAGGGAVRIVADHAVLNGAIRADASPPSGSSHCSGGSGGGIYLTCSTLAGTNGVITANASSPLSGNHLGGGAGGGRIAVVYDPDAQKAWPVPAIRFEAMPSVSAGQETSLPGEIGTLYFPDAAFFSPTNLFPAQWVGPCPTNLTLSAWTVSNVWTRLPAGVTVTVTNTLTVAGTNPNLSKLELMATNAESLSVGALAIDGAALSLGWTAYPTYAGRGYDWVEPAIGVGPTLTCAGDVCLTNGGQLHVYAGLAHPSAGPGYGALVAVGGTVTTHSNSWIFPVCHPTNGAAPLFRLNHLTLNPGGGFNAEDRGFAGANRVIGSDGALPAYGPGASTSAWNAGSGHGGAGAGTGGGPTYGSFNAPILPGSGSRCSGNASGLFHAPFGGGSVQVIAQGAVTVRGDILAGVNKGINDYETFYRGPGASGGSIYLRCLTFIGDAGGALRADADQLNANTWNGGGGGRIAVWRVADESAGSVATSVLGGIGLTETGAAGTVVWGWLSPPGSQMGF